MTLEANTGLNVSNQYGPRDTGGTVGSQATDNANRIFTIDMDGDTQPEAVIVPVGALVQEVIFEGTAGDAAIFVGVQDITAATYAIPVVVTDTDGNLNFTNTTGAGKVKVIAIYPEA
jgi:hypothetical protein